MKFPSHLNYDGKIICEMGPTLRWVKWQHNISFQEIYSQHYIYTYTWVDHSDIAWVSQPLKSMAFWLFVQQLVQYNNQQNIKILHYWPFVRGTHGLSPMDSPHKGPVISCIIWRVFSCHDHIMPLIVCVALPGSRQWNTKCSIMITYIILIFSSNDPLILLDNVDWPIWLLIWRKMDPAGQRALQVTALSSLRAIRLTALSSLRAIQVTALSSLRAIQVTALTSLRAIQVTALSSLRAIQVTALSSLRAIQVTALSSLEWSGWQSSMNPVTRKLAKQWSYLAGLNILTHWGRRQNDRLFADNIFKCIALTENVGIPIEISLLFVLKGPINKIPPLIR